VTWSSSSPPPPPQEKKSTTHPKMSPHQIFHHQCAAPGIDPIGKPPSVNPVHRTHAKDSHPKPESDHKLTPSRTRLSSPLAMVREQRRARSNSLPRRNATATCARAMGQDYPFTDPSPGANPTIHSSSLPRALGKLTGNVLPEDINFFLFPLGSFESLENHWSNGFGARSLFRTAERRTDRLEKKTIGIVPLQSQDPRPTHVSEVPVSGALYDQQAHS
jgi:hypothetical protein